MQTDKLHESFDFSPKSANSFQLDKKTKIRGCAKDKSVCRRQKLNAKTASLHSSMHNEWAAFFQEMDIVPHLNAFG